MAKGPQVSVVVPVFDNEASLPELHGRLNAALDGTDADVEIIYVNDGSRDGSLNVLRELPATAGSVSVADLRKNFGQSAAVMAGFSVARGDILVTIDADLENDPGDIPLLVEAVKEGADLACGVRDTRRAPLITRRGPSWLANQLVGNALGLELRDWGCGLNAVRSDIARQMLASNPMPRLPKIRAALLSQHVTAVSVAYSERRYGRSGYTVGRLAGFAALFLHDFGIRQALRRIVTASSAGATLHGGHATTVHSFTLSILCWSTLAAAAVFVRAGSTLLRKRPPSTPFVIRAIDTRAPGLDQAGRSFTHGT